MKLRTTLSLIGLCGFLGTQTLAQGHPLGAVEERNLALLLILPGEEVVVRYTHGSLDRAARLQVRLTDLQRRLAKWTKVRTPFVVYVLSPEEWKGQGLFRPYGFPVRTASMTVAVPGWGNPESVGLWREINGTNLPGAGGDFAVRGTAEELATLTLADGFAQLEFCRMFVERHRLVGGPEAPWLSEILAHLLLLQYTQTSKLPPALDLTAVLQTAARGHGFPSPEHYEGEMDLQAWLVHHARFAEAAESMWVARRKDAFKALWKLRRKQGFPLTFRTLAGEYPFLVDWRQNPTAVR